MKAKILGCIVSFVFLFFTQSWAQKKYPAHYAPLSMNANWGFQLPASDLATRFGSNMTVGGGLEYISLPKGWIINAQMQYLYGQNVKEDVLANMRTPDGAIIGDIGTYASVYLRERGFSLSVNGGKLFPFFDNGNRVGGLRLTLGSGFLQHKIRIQDNNGSAPQLTQPYLNGYDRLTNGWALTQFVGYQLVSRDKKLNLYIGLDCTEGFTRNRRGYNFDTRQRDDKKRLDILYGVRVGYSIALFSNYKSEEIEY